MALSSKPAKRIALASLILSVLFFVVTLLVGRWSSFFAVYAISWLIGSAALIWFFLTLQFHQRTLAEQEKLDMSQLAKDKQSSTIFQAEGERSGLFAVAQRRLEIFEKWFLGIFSAVIAIYQIGIGIFLFYSLKGTLAGPEIEFKQPLICAVCMTAVAFVSFLISRYSTGMSASAVEWKPLRAGGSIFLGIAVLCFALAIGLALAQFKMFVTVNVIAWIIPILLVVLGAETGLNLVLDIYRPRIKGQYSRSAFDSRLLGVINEPGGLFRSLAAAIDYQFGFKVSQTWFYKLLEKAIVPLVLFGAITMYLLSCIVIVAPNEEAIIEHFGNPVDADGQVRLIEPGLSFKWPWPIGIAYKYPTKKVMELNIGFVPKKDKDENKAGYGPLLWGKTHYEQEYQLLVASEQTVGESDTGAVPVSLVMAAIPVQYRIKDLYSFVYGHNEPEAVLEAICYRELSRFAASAKIEVDDEATMNQSLLGAGRAEAKKILTERIQTAAEAEGLGVEIVFLGLQGIHPPPDVATDYQQVVGAVQKKQALILHADALKNRILSSLAGSVEGAGELYRLAARYQQAREQRNEVEVERIGKLLDKAFAEAKGDIYRTLREAQSDAFEKATLARATGERFASQLKAYRAAEEIYVREQRLAVFEEAFDKIRKFVVVAEPNDAQIFIVDLQEKLTPSLYDISGFEESSEK